MKLRNIRIFSYENGGYTYEDHRGTAELEEGSQVEDGGSQRRCDGSVRLMTKKDVKAEPGDYVSLFTEEKPDKNRDFYITAVKDNRRGNLPHWRLFVGKRRRRT